MATSDKCPRCDCEGNRLACEMCYYYGFKCPGNCACCADQRESSAQRQARLNGTDQRESTQNQVRASNSNHQKQVRVSNSNDQRQPTQKQKRAPLRPLILRNVKKAISDSRKASSNASQSKVANSNVSESSTNQVNPTVVESNENKVNPTDNTLNSNKVNSAVQESNSDKVNPSKVKQSKQAKVNVETQTTKHKVTYVVEPELPAEYKEYVRKENEEVKRLWNNLFWPQWDKVPCEPHIPIQIENQRRKPNIISKEKLDEGINELIGDHCLNCHCKNPRESCDICRRTDFQCLGSCLCCLPFRAGQRVMIFVTRGLYKMPDGTFYGGGSVNLSSAVPQNSELSKALTATTVGAFFGATIFTLSTSKNYITDMLVNMRQTLLSYF